MHIRSGELHDTWRDVWKSASLEELEVGGACSDPWTLIHKPKVDEWISQLPAGPICEMGCGLGQWTRYYAVNGREAVGVDIVDEAIEKARTASETLRVPGASFVVADARTMPFSDKTFAGVTSFGVVEHFWDRETQQLINESFRILMPGGQLLVSTPNVWSMHTLTRPILKALRRWKLGLERSFSPNRLATYCERAGFRIRGKGVLESGTLFGAVVTRRLPALDTLSRWIERRQSTLGFVSYVVAERPSS